MKLVRILAKATQVQLYSDMKIPTRTKALLKWKKFQNKKKMESPTLSMSQKGEGVNALLVFLPENLEDARIMGHFIKSLTGNVAVHFICHQKVKSVYPDELQGNIISFSDEDINWWGIISENAFREKIKNIKMDALVNLNIKDHFLYHELSSSIQAPLKIGFHTDESDDYYNIIIDHRKGAFLEKSFDTLNKILGIE
ncbi:MAG: hypothetical protein ISR83_03600 [Candidatus Marinimicrobia bacterium]|nr:hypothetical protein [Candidatus Neomarinimicrobiota bacterium]